MRECSASGFDGRLRHLRAAFLAAFFLDLQDRGLLLA
jgi:hypothetical protein